jgi:uncharacterized lipoprotein YmbA
MIMRNHLRPTRLLAPVVLLVLAGCFKLSRESPRLQQYVLGGASTASAGESATTGATASASTGATPVGPSAPTRAGLTIGLRRIDLASYLAVPAIVTRRGANELILSEFHRWGGDLDEAINRAVAGHLAGLPPVRAVEIAPWQAQTRHDFLLQLHVTHFEGVADSAATEGRVHLLAGWDIIRPLDGRVLVRGSTDDRTGTWRVGDYAGLVTGLDAALLRLARDVSACLSRFPNDSTPPASCSSATGAGGTGR